jgi:hypothetical protein
VRRKRGQVDRNPLALGPVSAVWEASAAFSPAARLGCGGRAPRGVAQGVSSFGVRLGVVALGALSLAPPGLTDCLIGVTYLSEACQARGTSS